MNDYDLLGLMDTYKAARKQGLDVPNSFTEFLTGIQPLDQGPITIPTITQGETTYDQAISHIKQGEHQGKDATYNRGRGKENIPGFPIFGRQPTGQHKANIEQGKSLRTREELGYDNP